MRILFWENDPVWIFGLPNGFRDLGHEVIYIKSLTEESLKNAFLNFKPELVITIGWTPATTGNRVDLIKKYIKSFKIPLIYWATEDPTHTFSFTLPLLQKMQPDFVFTICPTKVNYYKKLGIRSAHMDFGFHKVVNHHTDIYDNYSHNIAVVANAYPRILKLYPKHYRKNSINTLISPLIKNNIRVDFYGWGWDKMSEFIGANIPENWIHNKLPFTEASKVYSSSKIILGLQNSTTQMTQRNFEILASKGFLITSDTPIIRNLFDPNKDLVVSNSPETTVQLIDYYLKNHEKRKEISIHGENSVKKHSYTNRARYMIEVLTAQEILKQSPF